MRIGTQNPVTDCLPLIDQLLTAAPTPALRVDASGKVAFRNPSFEAEFGASEQAEQAALRALNGSGVELDERRWSASVTDVGVDGLVLFLRPETGDVVPADIKKRRNFLSIASHDLRGLLANVRSWSSILASGRVQLDDRGKRAVEIIIRNTDKALSLMQEFFDSARSDLTPVPVDIQATDLRTEIDKVVEQVRNAEPDRPMRINVHLFADVTSVPVDVERFRHILRAFLEHSCERAAVTGEVELDIKRDDGGIRFEVKDRAPPPTDAELAAAFDRDERASTEKKLGTGFRLAFAAAEVAAHHGRVHVDVADGGARFGFWLPA